MSEEYIPVAEPIITESDAEAVYDTVASGWISMGDKVEEFENAFSEYVGADHSIAAFNGTVALHLVLAGLEIGPGDEVVVPSLTYAASANAVLYVDAVPVLCDVNRETYNVTRETVEPHLTADTEAIMCVDMNGMTVNYDELLDLAAEYDATLIADSAETLGGKYRDDLVGSQAPVHVFSMYPNKSITTGEGGMITTSDEELAQQLRVLRSQGEDERYNHVELGFNYRMTEMQAALGISQLKRVEDVMAEKQRVVSLYEEKLADLAPDVERPVVPDYVGRHSWYLYPISLADQYDRDRVVEELDERGIGTRTSFPPIHTQPYYVDRYDYEPSDYPESYRAWEQKIDLPISPTLSEQQIDRVVTALEDAMDSQ